MFNLSSLFNNGYSSDEFIKSMYDRNGYYSSNNFNKYNNENKQCFKLLDGPPFVSGYDIKSSNLHTGHCLISYLKSIFDIYNFMNKKNVDFTTSSDNHGLPTELLICKYLNLKDNQDILNIGLDAFNSTGLKLIDQFEETWKDVYKKLGRDYSFNHYRTSQTEYMDKVWQTLFKFYKKGFLYSGVKILPYSYNLETPLSNFEANENYKKIKCKSYYFKVGIKTDVFENLTKHYYFIFWTTTLWTVPFNIALCLNQNGEYCQILNNENDEVYVVEKNYINKIVKLLKLKDYRCEFFGYGFNLINIEYKPIIKLFDYSNIYKTLNDDYVDLNGTNGSERDKQLKSFINFMGSGIVHLSPAFGEDDYRVCLKNGLVDNQSVFNFCLIDSKCRFKYIEALKELENKNIFDPFVSEYLENKFKDSIVATETIEHNYPHSPRTNEPLIYKVCKSYFINVKENKNLLIEQNKKINWKPKHIQNGRFGKWLKNAEDWCISRNRFFGTPLNIWVNRKEENDFIVIKNIKQLETLTNKKFDNIHPEFIFNLPIEKNNKVYENVKLTFDCWFESGCSCLIGFDNNNKFVENNFRPYDLCIEGIDQCRGYFYTSLIISTFLYNQPPFNNCICTGLIQDEKGKKLSKSSGNYKQPETYINYFGSDAFRLYLLGSVLSNGENLKFNEKDIRQYKQKIIQFINCIRFLNDYNILYHKEELKFNEPIDINVLNFENLKILDKWILSELDWLIIKVNENFKNLEIKQSVELLLSFIEKLANYYVKFSRDEIKSNNTETFLISKFIIQQFIILSTPFIPFLSEYLYNLNIDDQHKRSIKFLDYPKPLNFYNQQINEYFDKFVNVLQNIRTLASQYREDKDKYINKLLIKSFYDLNFIKPFEKIIKKDLKILNIDYLNIEPSDYLIKCNFKAIGQKCKEIAKVIKNHKFPITDIKRYLNNEIEYLDFSYNNINYKFDNSLIESIKPIYNNENDKEFDGYVFYFDLSETKEVEEKNIIKSLIDKIQDKRKEMNLNVYDQIVIYVEDVKENIQIYINNIDYIHKSIVNNNVIFLTNIKQNIKIKIVE